MQEQKREQHDRGGAIFGDLSIITSKGEELRASNDLRLAWAWAEAEVNARPELFKGGWTALTYGRQCTHVSHALAALRGAAQS